jgi:hypothetical protein
MSAHYRIEPGKDGAPDDIIDTEGKIVAQLMGATPEFLAAIAAVDSVPPIDPDESLAESAPATVSAAHNSVVLKGRRCSNCGSTDCGLDAVAVWDDVAQGYVLGNTFDDGWCEDCSSDAAPEEYELDGDELAEAQRAIDRAAATGLIAALEAVLPYARSRAEDMHESGGGDTCKYWRKANAAVEAAEAAIKAAKAGA